MVLVIKRRHALQVREPDAIVPDTVPPPAPTLPPTAFPGSVSYVQTGSACTRCNYVCPKPCNDDWDMCARGQSWNIARWAKQREKENVHEGL